MVLHHDNLPDVPADHDSVMNLPYPMRYYPPEPALDSKREETQEDNLK